MDTKHHSRSPDCDTPEEIPPDSAAAIFHPGGKVEFRIPKSAEGKLMGEEAPTFQLCLISALFRHDMLWELAAEVARKELIEIKNADDLHPDPAAGG